MDTSPNRSPDRLLDPKLREPGRGPVRRPRTIDRRQLLLGAGATLLAAACTSADDAKRPGTADGTGTPADDGDGGDGTTAATDGVVTDEEAGDASEIGAGAAGTLQALAVAQFEALSPCAVLGATTAGPFGLDEQFVRADLTEDLPGHPVRLGLRLVDADCDPITDAMIEVWQADASGDYSAFIDDGGGKDDGPGTTFLRGTLPVDEDGIADFTTIYPGFYPGRPPHLHVRAHVGGEVRFTTQLFFDDGYSSEVYRTDPYREFGQDFTRNADDSIAGEVHAAATNLVTLEAGDTSRGQGTVALANLAVPT